MNTIKVRDIEIGAGAPKIIVRSSALQKEDILNEAKTFRFHSGRCRRVARGLV